MNSVGTPLLWASSVGVVLALVLVDLFANRRKGELSIKEAIGWTLFWVIAALGFGVFVAARFGRGVAMQYGAGYLMQEAMSADNLFVFLVLFNYFGVTPNLQRRVLFWGIFGAQLTRSLFILAGAALLQRFHWILYGFGAVLIYSAYKLVRGGDEPVKPEGNFALRMFKRFIPITDGFRDSRFLIKEEGRWRATPLLLVLVVVEATDIMFSVDDIPAIFGITTDAFIVFTSNLFAIVGMRSLFFLIAHFLKRLHLLKYGLSLILTFVGVKLLISHWVDLPASASLGVIAATLAITAVASLTTKPVAIDS